jgi:uncharacterized protein YdaU (DUF1376 family)
MAKKRDTSAHIWFPLYVRDWLSDGKVRGCTGTQRAILLDLWCYQWQEGQLPNDLSALCRMLGAVEPADVQHVVAHFFEATNDGQFLRSRRLFLEKKSAESNRAKKRAAIQKARDAKAAKTYAALNTGLFTGQTTTLSTGGPSPSPSPAPEIGNNISSTPLPPTLLDDLQQRRQAARARLEVAKGTA